VHQAGQARIGTQKCQHRAYANFGPGNRSVDALVRQKQGAFDLVGIATGLQRALQIGEVGQVDEFVEGGGEVRGIGLHALIIPAPPFDRPFARQHSR
jgi:hypothetical protein